MGNRQSNPTQQYRLYCKQHQLAPLTFQSKYLDYDRQWEVQVTTAYGYYRTIQPTKQKGKDEISQYFLNIDVNNINRPVSNVMYEIFPPSRKLIKQPVLNRTKNEPKYIYTNFSTMEYVKNPTPIDFIKP